MDGNTRRQVDIINQKTKELHSLYRIAARKSGIPNGEIRIWSMLLNAEIEYSQQDLCELLSLPKQTMNSLIASLMKRGYVLLEHAAGTKNRKVIRLTEEGCRYGKNRVLWIFEAEQKAMEGADPQEVQVCISMFDKYILHLKKEFQMNDVRKKDDSSECKNISDT